MVAGNVERRSMGALGRMGIVAGLHVGVIFLIGRSLGVIPPITLPPDDVKVTIIDEHRPPDTPPAPKNPVFENPDIPHLPIPIVPIDMPSDAGITADLVQPDDFGVPDEGGTAVVEPRIVGVRQDTRHPLSQPRYPSWDKGEGNQGNVDVEVYVLENGRVGNARIVRSSGFERLDQSALDEAKRNWRLLPATRDGVPIAQWYKIRVTFKLTDANR